VAGADAQTRMMERLLADPVFRARFRNDPAGVAREEGAEDLADELSVVGDPMQTLDFRESRSSVAGVMIAAAVEGIGIYELGKHLLPHLEDAQAAAGNSPPSGGASHDPAASPPGGSASSPPGGPASLPAQAVAAAEAPNASSGSDGSDQSESDNWDETHESGSPEDSGGSGDDGNSDSGSDEDSGGSGNDGLDGNSDGQSAQDASPSPGGGLQVPDVAGGYPGENATQGEVAAWMASAAQKRGLPAELPVMASLVESGMKNLPGGDADSVGFFQMRVGTWNQGAYSGYPNRPQLQLQWFLDHAAAVKKQRLASGLPVDDPKHYGEWIADVERPAAQYRGRYQLRLDEAQALLKQAGGKRGTGNDGLDLVDAGAGSHAGRRALVAVAEVKKQLGTPYRWGGSSPKTGFDCSGLMQWAYAKAGIRLPRVSEQQILAANGTPVSRGHLLPGDLVFFRDSTGDVHHVGMSLGGDKFIAAPHTGDVVKYASLKDPYYAQQFTGARRFDRPVAAEENVRAASEARQSSDSAEAEAARLARAALERDAAEVQRSNSELFKALARQEGHQANEVQFLKAVGPAR
jgi:cell wall-associated NlpC family hydrolase